MKLASLLLLCGLFAGCEARNVPGTPWQYTPTKYQRVKNSEGAIWTFRQGKNVIVADCTNHDGEFCPYAGIVIGQPIDITRLGNSLCVIGHGPSENVLCLEIVTEEQK